MTRDHYSGARKTLNVVVDHEGDILRLGSNRLYGGGGPSVKITYKQDAVNPPPGVYSTWDEAYTAAAKAAKKSLVELEIDNTASSFSGALGTSCFLPQGDWDMNNITLVGKAFEGSSVNLQIAADTTLRNISRLGSRDTTLRVYYEGGSSAAIKGSTGTIFLSILGGFASRIRCANGGAPLIQNDGGFMVILMELVDGRFGDFDLFDPTFDLAGGSCFFLNLRGDIRDRSISDSAGGGSIQFFLYEGSQTTPALSVRNNFPGLSGSTVTFPQRYQHRVTMSETLDKVTNALSPYSEDIHRNVVRIDTSDGAVSYSPVYASPMAGEVLTVKDVGGQAAANNITIQLTARGSIFPLDTSVITDGDTFVLDDGSNSAVTLEFDSDGSVSQTATLRAVNFVASDSLGVLSNAIASGINGAPSLDITAVATDSGQGVMLTNTTPGAAGNVPITFDTTNSGILSVRGMAGGDETFEDGSQAKVISTSWGSRQFVTDGVDKWIEVSNPHHLDALGGGDAATLGTISGSGPATAAQDSWIQLTVSGTSYWVPAWQ